VGPPIYRFCVLLQRRPALHSNDPLVLVQSLENVPFLFIGNLSWPGHRTSVAAPVRLYELFVAIFLVIGLAVWLRSCWPMRSNGYERVLVWAMPILALFICAYVFKSEIRYRVPFDVYFIPVAIRGWMSILQAPRTDAVGEGARDAASLG
jgi:hypothetical protein